MEAIAHGGVANNSGGEGRSGEAEQTERDGPKPHLNDVQAVLVPGGFGVRGIEGKIATIQYAREERIPFFGICLGMQCAVIEFSRSSRGFAGANSNKVQPSSPHPAISLIPEQQGITDL